MDKCPYNKKAKAAGGRVVQHIPPPPAEPPHLDISNTGTVHPPEIQRQTLGPLVVQDGDPEREQLEILAGSLSPSQKIVYDEVLTGKSLFFTGEAGTGKSFLLDVIVKRARLQGLSVHVTASTGISACAVGGTTLHSFAGVGLAEEPSKDLIKKLMDGRTPHLRKAAKRWREVDLLVVDECSMLDPSFFDKLDDIARTLRSNQDPFGGMQVVLTGDFFQLPPVVRGRQTQAASSQQVLAPLPSMIFETRAWKTTVGDRIHVLKEAHRQRDEVFLSLLRGLRNGSLTREHMSIIVNRMRASGDVPGDAVKLYPTRKEVETVNEYRLSMLPGDERVFEASDKGQPYILESNRDHWMVRRIFLSLSLQNLNLSFISKKAPQRLVLKEGALVMFIKNVSIEEGVMNGTTGRVVGFGGVHDLPKVQLNNGNVVQTSMSLWEIKQGDTTIASREQVPLMLAYAITIHKSQGMSLAKVEVNMTRMFEKAQLYVAMSRCTSLDGLYLLGNIPSSGLLCPNPTVAAWWSKVSES